MKTSKKILFAVVALIVLLMITGLMVVRKHLKIYVSQWAYNQYLTIPTVDFEKLHIPGNWDVKVRQGRHCRVELQMADTVLKPMFESVGGTLYMKPDTLSITAEVHVRVTAPKLTAILAGDTCRINITGFQSDSLTVTMGDGCSFMGMETNFNYVSFKSDGNARIELTDFPDF